MLWIILAIIGAINLLLVVFLVVAGLIRERRPLTPQEAREQAIEDEEQVASLRQWAFRQAAKKARKVRV